MLLPELLHLPSAILMAVITASGVLLPVSVPFAASLTQSSGDKWIHALGVIMVTVTSALATWFAFRTARRSTPTGRFLGWSGRIWTVAIPLAYFTGMAFGTYLCFLFYV